MEVLQDAAISGASSFRPAYQTLLEHARENKFDIVVSEALDRLSRDQSDVAGLYKCLSFAGIAIHTVSEGLVTELQLGLKGTMNALFLKDLAAKTHRGLRGRVEAGKSGGGLSYGYQLVRQVDDRGEQVRGNRRIHAEQHPIVTRIFTMFAAGSSPIAIAKALNFESIPGPGGRAWRDTTIRGHRERGTGILRNELYVGRMVWNRMRYVKDPESGRRISRMNPAAQWITKDVPHLRFLDNVLWAEVQKRLGSIQANMTADPAVRVPYRDSRRAQHILTGRVFCGVCGGTMSNSGQDYLTCTVASRQGVCKNRKSLKRSRIEELVIDALRTRLMQPEACAEFSNAFQAECARAEKEASGADASRQRELEKVRAQLEARQAKLEQEAGFPFRPSAPGQRQGARDGAGRGSWVSAVSGAVCPGSGPGTGGAAVAALRSDMPGADDLMMRVYAAMAQKERELISERTRAALAAAKARGAVLGGDRGYRPSAAPCARSAAIARGGEADRVAHRLLFEIDGLRRQGVTTAIGLARALTERGVPTPREGRIWTHTTVSRLLARVAA